MGYENFTHHGRATKGQIGYRVTEKNGEIAGGLSVQKSDEVVCISSQGNIIKLKVKDIPVMGKMAQGVRIVNIQKPDFLVGVARVVKED